MHISDKIGGLPGLGFVFDHGPLYAAVVMLIADFGIICVLMWIEGIPPWQRSHYKTFLWNDTIFIPLYMLMAVVALQDAKPSSAFYTQGWFHGGLLVLGFAISIVIEVGAVKAGQYTLSQELSPSKLWHTFIFGVVFYWLASTIIPVLLGCANRPVVLVLVFAAIVGFVGNMYRDAVLPFPKDAHLEGTWVPWEWHRRSYPL